jgi:hypothetical protein
VKIIPPTIRTLAILAFSATSAFAQTAGSGSIAGTIKDPAGAVVAGAAVVVHSTDTGADRSISTNDSGLYSAVFLQPGHYTVTVGKTGFTRVERKDITLEVGRTLEIDFALTVQTGTETVTITSELPIVDVDKTEVSQQVSKNLIQNLPIAGRRWDNFVLLTPGVTTDGGLVSYRGISGLYNNNSVDGANNNQAFFSEARGRSTSPYGYSLDSLQEFHVSASNYSAEFGQAAGGVVNAITKSGTNSFHGDLFYYLRYPALNALDSFNKSQGIYTQATHQLQQFGASVGGPAIKDKLFYFFTYDGFRKVFPVAYTSSTPNPLTNAALVCPIQLTSAQCTASKTYLSSLIGGYPRAGVQDLAFGKIDYQVNSRNHLSASFDWLDYHANNGYSPNPTYSNSSVTTNGSAVTHERIFVASWDSTINSSSVNTFRFQWGLDNEIVANNAPGPSVGIASVTTYGMPNALPRAAFPNEHRLQFADTLSKTVGTHQIKVGFDINAIHEVLVNLFQGGGIYSYTGSAAAAYSNWALDVFNVPTVDATGKVNTGQHYAAFTQVTDPITGVGRDDFYDKDFAGFVEDSWKVRSNLTVNLGVRYEVQTVPQPDRPNYTTPLTKYYTQTINNDTNNFGPRIGIAYNPMKGLVIRAGWGMFYGKTSNSTWYAVRVENGVYQQTFNCNPTSCPTLQFPNLIFAPPGGSPVAPFAGAVTPRVTAFTPNATTQLSHGVNPDFVNPLVHEGEFTIEKQLPFGMSFTAGYIFSRGLHLPVFVDSNIAPSTQTRTYNILNAAGGVGQTITEPFYTTRLNTNTGVILNGFSSINSWYNGGIFTLRKPMNHGLELVINYTYSKSIDDGAVAGANGTFFGTDPPLNPFNQKAENSLSDLDQRHRFVGSVVFAPQFFKKIPNKALRYALDGFMFSSITTLAGAQPVFATISGFAAGGVDSGVTGAEITNTGGPTGGRPPQFGRNVFFGHNLYNEDLRVTRDFAFREKYHFQILGEAFNLFNHTNITSVNGTAFNYSAATGTTLASGITGLLTPNAAFLAPTSSSSTNGLYGARQLQVSAKIIF